MLEYTSVSSTRTLTFLPEASTWSSGDEAFELDNFAAGVASAGLAQGHNLVSDFACGSGVVGCIEPLLSKCFDLIGALGAFQSFVHQVGYALTDFLGGDVHAKAEFGEVFEE